MSHGRRNSPAPDADGPTAASPRRLGQPQNRVPKLAKSLRICLIGEMEHSMNRFAPARRRAHSTVADPAPFAAGPNQGIFFSLGVLNFLNFRRVADATSASRQRNFFSPGGSELS